MSKTKVGLPFCCYLSVIEYNFEMTSSPCIELATRQDLEVIVACVLQIEMMSVFSSNDRRIHLQMLNF